MLPKFRQALITLDRGFLRWHYWGYVKGTQDVFIGPLPPRNASESQQWIGVTNIEGVDIYVGDMTNDGIVRFYDDLSFDGQGGFHPGFYAETGGYDDDNELNWHNNIDENTLVIGNIIEGKF